MGTSSWTTSVLAALALVLCAVVAATSERPPWPVLEAPSSPERSTEQDDATGGSEGQADRGEERPAPDEDSAGGGEPATAGGLLTLAVVVLASALVVVAALRLRLVRRRSRLTQRAGPRTGARPSVAEADTDEDDPLTTALDAGVRAVGEGVPRNAIVRAWLRLEDGVVSEHLPPRPADTPTELVTRALTAYRLDAEAIHRLAELYEEARFSVHPVTEAHRREAGRCLHRLLASVGEKAVR